MFSPAILYEHSYIDLYVFITILCELLCRQIQKCSSQAPLKTLCQPLWSCPFFGGVVTSRQILSHIESTLRYIWLSECDHQSLSLLCQTSLYVCISFWWLHTFLYVSIVIGIMLVSPMIFTPPVNTFGGMAPITFL